MTHGAKTRSSAAIAILVVVLIVLVVNLIALNVFARWDVTDNKIYSISEPSKKIIGALDDRLTVKVFFTEDLPAPHNTDRRYLRDILDDFKAYSNGKLAVEFLDPLKAENKDEAARYQLQPVRFDVRGSTKAESILGFKAVVMLYGGRQEVIPFIMDMDNFEYDFMRMVKRLKSPGLPHIAFTTGHGEPEFGKGLSTVQQMLGEDFQATPLNLAGLADVPDDIKALFIVGPKTPFAPWEVYLLDQYIMHGGRVAFFVHSYDFNQEARGILPVSTGLDDLLRHYGLGVNKDIVIDQQCYRYMNFRQVQGGFVPENVEVPFFVSILSFDPNNIVTKYQRGMTVVGGSSLDTTLSHPEGVARTVLFRSSPKSGSVTGDVMTALQTITPTSYNRSNLPLAAVLAGSFRSLYADQSRPEFTGTDTVAARSIPEKMVQGKETRIVVVGSGTLFDDNAAGDRSGRFNQNFVFFRNLVDWLAQDEDLISIRSKQNLFSPFTKIMSESGQTTIKLINTLAMPIVVIIFGLIRWQINRSIKRKGAL